MKIYLVEESLKNVERDFVSLGGKHGLVSWWYEKKVDKFKEFKEKYPDVEIMLDSGAFSARFKRIELSVDDYISFCDQVNDYVDHIISLDSVESWEISLKNYDYMRKHLKDNSKLIPVYHTTEPYHVLEHYCKTSDYIAVAIYLEIKMHKRRFMNYLRNILDRIPKGKKVHLLGVASPAILFRFSKEIESCDSTAGTKIKGDQNRGWSMSGMMTSVTGFTSARINKDQKVFLNKMNVMAQLKLEKDINDYLENNING